MSKLKSFPGTGTEYVVLYGFAQKKSDTTTSGKATVIQTRGEGYQHQVASVSANVAEVEYYLDGSSIDAADYAIQMQGEIGVFRTLVEARAACGVS
jgi:hypothetical protein